MNGQNFVTVNTFTYTYLHYIPGLQLNVNPQS